MEHDLNILMNFGIKENVYLLAIATNIAVLLMTDFVLQVHKCSKNILLTFLFCV